MKEAMVRSRSRAFELSSTWPWRKLLDKELWHETSEMYDNVDRLKLSKASDFTFPEKPIQNSTRHGDKAWSGIRALDGLWFGLEITPLHTWNYTMQMPTMEHDSSRLLSRPSASRPPYDDTKEFESETINIKFARVKNIE